MTRWRIACDACTVEAWIGSARDASHGWCEGCQRAYPAAAGLPLPVMCEWCGQPITVAAPRFEELFGRLQEIAAVLAAWDGDPAPLARLLPERPRFLSDLTPPLARPADPAPVRVALESLLEGRYHAAHERLEALLAAGSATADDERLWHALAIATDRLGLPARAEQAWTRVIDGSPGSDVARLGRGALRARRGDYAGAREDFAHAGDRFEARWDRAAALVLEAVATAPSGMPAPEVIARARAEAPPASDYWIDPTIGRLLFTALVERARMTAAPAEGAHPQASSLRAAERELEFGTYWDRAMVVLGYTRLGLGADAASAARALAANELAQVLDQPAIAGPAGAVFAPALEHAMRAIAAGEAHAAWIELESLLARADLRHYRVPCTACGRGSLGVETMEEDD